MEPERPLDYPPPPMPRPAGRPWSITGFVLAGLAVLLGPLSLLLGPAAVVCGVVGLRRGDPWGKRAVLIGVAAMVGGLLLSALLADAEAGALAAPG